MARMMPRWHKESYKQRSLCFDARACSFSLSVSLFLAVVALTTLRKGSLVKRNTGAICKQGKSYKEEHKQWRHPA